MRSITVMLVLAIATFACSADTSAPSVDPPSFAKGGPSKQSNPTTSWRIPVADSELAFRSDGDYVDDGYSVYANGHCGVSTVLYTSGSGDATITFGKPRGKSDCSRTFTLHYPDGASETGPAFNNLRDLHRPDAMIDVGDTVLRTLGINVGTRCGRLLFGVGRHGHGVGSDSVTVTRSDVRTWHVRSQEGATLALCENNNMLYDMPVSFMIVADTDLE